MSVLYILGPNSTNSVGLYVKFSDLKSISFIFAFDSLRSFNNPNPSSFVAYLNN